MNKDPFSLSLPQNRKAFLAGVKDGIPIGLGYLAVSFSLGIMARNIGLNPIQCFFASLLCNASAGEYAGFTTIAAAGTYLEIAVITFIANARYLLMSCAASQRFSPETSTLHRILVGYDLTDELFGIAIAQKGYFNPNYSYGAICVAAPSWAIGTALGCVAGNLMPARLVSALSVALFGMFLAIIIPPARKDRVIAALVTVSFVASFACSRLPVVSSLSEGTRTIILTVLIAGAASVLCPYVPKEADS